MSIFEYIDFNASANENSADLDGVMSISLKSVVNLLFVK